MDPIPLSRLACVMVGLPARGKTYTARKVTRYLTWLGHRARIFNVGNYRRKAVGAEQTADFFDPDNQAYANQREVLANQALQDMLAWMGQGGIDGQSLGTPSLGSPKLRTFGNTGAGVNGPSCIALYDATNSTVARRKFIMEECARAGVKVFFIENLCEDEEIIMNNIKEVKVSSPDYVGWTTADAIADFQHRIAHYAKSYQTITKDELMGQIAFVKVMNIGKQVSWID
jgi:6-phosphofructo-2-kinase / fructose-2,6-biphosphatase 2